MSEPLISVKNLTKTFQVGKGFLSKGKSLRAVGNVSFDIMRGETLCLVGESGCGKSTLGRSILQLIKPSSGQVLYNGTDLVPLSEKEMRPYRQELQIVFQDPYASLNPRMTVREILGAPLDVYHISQNRQDREDRILSICQVVGVQPDWLDKYPHEFSGGQRQRLVIARALMLNPKFVVCDEPVSALDVSIRSQVLNLMKDIQNQYGFSYLFISHDLSVVNYIGDRIAVMYLGELVELADKRELFQNPQHPYTRALLSAVPVADVNYKRQRTYLEGDIPSPMNPPSGCKFRTRCPHATPACAEKPPELQDQGGLHFVSCHRCGEI